MVVQYSCVDTSNTESLVTEFRTTNFLLNIMRSLQLGVWQNVSNGGRHKYESSLLAIGSITDALMYILVHIMNGCF
jgi:hypothetical protein